MRINSLSFSNVRGLPAGRLDFFDSVTGRVRPRTVIASSNGTGTLVPAVTSAGETTILNEGEKIEEPDDHGNRIP